MTPSGGSTPPPIVVKPILVKVVGRVNDPALLARQLSQLHPPSDRVRFTFDPAARDYDWLAVYDNLPVGTGLGASLQTEELPCPQANTLLFTSEPTSIKIYGRAFTRQFGAVYSSQEDWAILAPRHRRTQSGLRWYYGISPGRLLTVDDIAANPPLSKTRDASVICSTKAQGHTLHGDRLAFTLALKAALPEIDHFGAGVRPMADKAEALDPYRYHVTIENHLAPHHWTEKLADAFLGCTLPFYCGAPDAADYFPKESFIPIDLSDPVRVADRIRAAIADREYDARLPYILEARRRVIEDYNFITLIARHVEERALIPSAGPSAGRGRIMSQRTARLANPIYAAADFLLKERVQLQNRFLRTWR